MPCSLTKSPRKRKGIRHRYDDGKQIISRSIMVRAVGVLITPATFLGLGEVLRFFRIKVWGIKRKKGRRKITSKLSQKRGLNQSAKSAVTAVIKG